MMNHDLDLLNGPTASASTALTVTSTSTATKLQDHDDTSFDDNFMSLSALAEGCGGSDNIDFSSMSFKRQSSL
jgi:hypothetical protein